MKKFGSRKGKGRLVRLLTFVVVALVYSGLIFGGLREKGFCYYDEAYNVLEARFLADGFRLGTGYLFDRLGGDAVGLRAYVKAHGGRPGGYYLSYGKPAHSLILALGMISTGGKNWGAHLAMGVCGLVLLVGVWRWGLNLAGRSAGRWSALLLGASAFFLIYARETLAEIDSAALMTLGLWWLARMRGRAPRRLRLSLVGVGLLFGLAFTANYRWFWLPLIFVLETWVLYSPPKESSDPGLSRGSRLVWLFLGAALPLIAAELPGQILRWYFLRLRLPPPFETYSQQLARLYFFHPTSVKGFHLSGVPTYVYLLWRWTSPLFLILIAAGAWRLLRRGPHRRVGVFLVVPPLTMLTFYSFYIFNFARFATLSLPFLALLAGAGVPVVAAWVVKVFGRTTRGDSGRIGLLRVEVIVGLLTIAVGLPIALRVRAIRSPFPAVASWLESHGDGLCASTDLHVMRVVYGRSRVLDVPVGLRNFSKFKARGVRWVVLGPLRKYWGEIPAVERLMATESPVGTWKNPCFQDEQYPFEHNTDFVEALRGSLFKGAERVEVYSLSDSSPRGPTRAVSDISKTLKDR